MKKLKVTSLPIKDVITDLANELGTEQVADCDVYSLSIPAKFGKGRITGINFSSGIGILIYDCVFNSNLEISFKVNEVHPAKFLYLTQGSVKHGFDNNRLDHVLTQHQSAIVASSSGSGHKLSFNKGERVRICSIEINRQQFLSEMECDVKLMTNPLKEVLLDVNATKRFYHEGAYSLKLFDMLREMNDSDHSGLIQRLFLLSIASGVLREQLVQYERDLDNSPKDYLLRRNEIDLVKKAVLIINDTMAHPINIESLAKSIGTNSTKIQQCFKLVYGTTINGFMKNARLEKAAEMLIVSDQNVSEIVKEVGLMNRSYFSKLFKERYDSTPKAYRIKFKKRYTKGS